jgi:hypothetical protein
MIKHYKSFRQCSHSTFEKQCDLSIDCLAHGSRGAGFLGYFLHHHLADPQTQQGLCNPLDPQATLNLHLAILLYYGTPLQQLGSSLDLL